MKWAIITASVMALGVGAYFLFFSPSKPDYSSAYNTFLNRIDAIVRAGETGKKIFTDTVNLADSGLKKLKEIAGFVSSAPAVVSSTIGEIRNSIPPGAIDLLSSIAGLNKQNLGSYIFSNGSTAASAQDLRKEVCVQFASSSKVEYVLQNPFSPHKDYNYSINWGDAKNDSGKVTSSSEPLNLTHAYEKIGDYVNAFNISAGTTTLSAEIKVCVN